MSIRGIVQANLGNKLFVLPPLIKGDPSVRTVIVSHEVLDAVDGDLPDDFYGLRRADFRQTLDTFTGGDEITVSDDPFRKPPNTFMARISPIELEVVDIRTLAGPGIRAFGSIIEPDTFLALTWDYREDITDFDYECKRCNHDWKQLFGSLEPYSKGKRLDECITNAHAV